MEVLETHSGSFIYAGARIAKSDWHSRNGLKSSFSGLIQNYLFWRKIARKHLNSHMSRLFSNLLRSLYLERYINQCEKTVKILEHYIYLYYIKNNNIIKYIVLQTVLNNALEFFLFSILEMKTLELYLLHSKWALSYYTHCACMQRLHSLSLRKHNLSQWYFLLARKLK